MSFNTVIKYVGTNFTNWAWSVQNVVNGIMNGKTNNIGSVTLTANQATSTVNTAIGDLGNDTVILFMPKTANAAAELASGNMYVSSRTVSNDPSTQPNFVITHTNNAQTDRDFDFVLIG